TVLSLEPKHTEIKGDGSIVWITGSGRKSAKGFTRTAPVPRILADCGSGSAILRDAKCSESFWG
ncbi:MAG: hypothetical protein OXG94_03620, partial [Bacteroidetes bacterium]|nr:hypothetical protein [Bacteroidota bacterium]